MPSAHFKMKTANSIPTKVTPNCYMAKFVIKDFKVFENVYLVENFFSLLACLMVYVLD